MGRVTWDGWAESCRMVWRVGLNSVSAAMTPPVLVLRSKRGKLLLETSSRTLCPALNTLLVAHRSMV